MEKLSAQLRKKRKFLLVLPILVLPFVTLIFWAMGGGSIGREEGTDAQQGLNTDLPDAQLEEGTLDKMSLYRDSPPDSGRNEPEWAGADTSAADTDSYGYRYPADPYPYENYGQGGGYPPGDPNEARIRQRLDELERIIAAQEMAAGNNGSVSTTSYSLGYRESGDSLERLEEMMERMSGHAEPDPELQVLDGMLEKIIDIQHPDRLRERSIENRGSAFPVTTEVKDNVVPVIRRPGAAGIAIHDTVTEMDTPVTAVVSAGNGFHGLGSPSGEGIQDIPAIPAVVHGTQTVVSGAELELRMLSDIYVNGIRVPAGHLVTGRCMLDGERLQVSVGGLQYRNYQLPVSLAVYDLDGNEGIRIPGAIGRDAAKDGTDRAVQSIQLMSMDPTLWGQAAGAGVEAAKGLLSKSAKLVRVTVKAGHPVVLYDEQANRQ
ncbi:conjugative transposon protein TraM [Parapedobacter sp. ISTM3]|uniref:conjugative transposon protein TraM n=1 Tax=Parapedobacter sp. ISTM3 TaxID=2800130 RepID=UPI001903B420|nr:conjugative transposon protein TraM [Parapedobacter sp. ISTM3]MBK1439793.1 conjugative transposon protein TraM [Parapedobacter sp. ISTM3]